MQNFHVIYDSERGALILFYSPKVKNAVFQFSPAINPVKATQIKKGMKIYDYENSHFFSLSLPESATVLKLLSTDTKKDITIGSIHYKMDEKNGNRTIRIGHFPQKKDERTKDNIIVSELSITVASNPVSGATVTYKKIQNKKVTVNIPIRVSYSDYLALKLFLEKHPDFIASIHSLFMYNKVLNLRNMEKTQKRDEIEEYYEDVEENQTNEEYQPIEIEENSTEESEEKFF